MFRTFSNNREGSVLVFVALAAVAVVGSVGVAVDVGRSQMVQAKLQNAVDAAGLAAGATINSDDLEGIATKYINLNFNTGNLGATLGEVETTLSEDGKTISCTTPCEPVFLAQAEYMMVRPEALHAAVSSDYATRWPDLKAPTLADCKAFCAAIIQPELVPK